MDVMNCQDVVIENKLMQLTVGSDCIAKSLILKSTGEECLQAGEEIALFSVTQDRPFNNEVKLAYPCKRTTFQGNSLRREGDKLIIGFEITPFKVVVGVSEKSDYVTFTLEDYIVGPEDYEGLSMDTPPVAEFRLWQLPVKNRERFGQWLNVMWDDRAAINVLATSPHARIDSERRKGYRILTADAVRGIKLKGCSAALIVSKPEELLDAIDAFEVDYDLPRGVQSRRSDSINASIYSAWGVTPDNLDEFIAYAKKGGFRMMCLPCGTFRKHYGNVGYSANNDPRLNDRYPNGLADVKAMVDRVKAAGLTPGYHFLHTHIGMKTPYVTPVADYRLNLTRHFTLSKPIGTEDREIYVAENPEGAVMYEKCRVLRFGGELIRYEGYVTEYPYRFTGCVRGAYDTNIVPHEMGTIGGILDMSEFTATSCYLDQNTDLQDEVAENIAAIYDTGFEFVYFDGSEGTNPPFEYHIPNAQYRVYKRFAKEPLFAEGAAKGHFSWHMLSGSNAFDRFPTAIFKETLNRYQMVEAAQMRNEFTRVNFGWWGFFMDAGPDIYEYGTSRGAGWDCPGTLQALMDRFKEHRLCDDIFEVFRRWEDVREKKWLTEEQKAELRRTDVEHTLLINEAGDYELVPYYCIRKGLEKGDGIDAFVFTRNGKNYVTFWCTQEPCKLKLKLPAGEVVLEREIGREPISFAGEEGSVLVTAGRKCYLSSNLSVEELTTAFEEGEIIK